MRVVLRYFLFTLSIIFLVVGGITTYSLIESSSIDVVDYCRENIKQDTGLIDEARVGNCVEDMWKVEGMMPIVAIMAGISMLLGLFLFWLGVRTKSRQLE